MCTFHSTPDLADTLGDYVLSCDTQFRNFGGKTKFAGRIVTVRCMEDNGLVKKLLNSPGKGKVLVVDAGGNLHTAMVGDQIAKAALENGWKGIIVNGAIRDSEEIGQLDIAVKALGTNPRRSAKDGVGKVNERVSFGGVDFIADHTVYGDADGIVVMDEPICE